MPCTLRFSLVYWHELTKKTLPFALKAAAKNRFIHTWLNRAQRQSSIKQNYAEIQLYELFKQHTDQQKVKVFWKLCGCQGGHADVARGPHLPCACVFMSKQVALWHYISTWHTYVDVHIRTYFKIELKLIFGYHFKSLYVL